MKHLKFNSQQTCLVCLNLRQYDTFVALAIAFNLGRNKLPRPGPFSLGYSFRPALLA